MPEAGDTDGVSRGKMTRPNKLKSKFSVGQRLRQLRVQRGLTLSQVSDLSGVSISTLSRVENAQSSLNFTSVLQLIEGLNTPLSTLIGPQTHQITGRRSVTRGGAGRIFETPQLIFEVLCGDLTHKTNVFWKVVVKARKFDEYDDYKRHPGEEFILVLDGQLELHSEMYEPLRLDKGDSIFFDSSMGHAYVSSGEGDAHILMSNTISSQPLEGFIDETL